MLILTFSPSLVVFLHNLSNADFNKLNNSVLSTLEVFSTSPVSIKWELRKEVSSFCVVECSLLSDDYLFVLESGLEEDLYVFLENMGAAFHKGLSGVVSIFQSAE